MEVAAIMPGFSATIHSPDATLADCFARADWQLSVRAVVHSLTGCAPKPHSAVSADAPDATETEQFAVTIHKPAGPPLDQDRGLRRKGQPNHDRLRNLSHDEAGELGGETRHVAASCSIRD